MKKANFMVDNLGWIILILVTAVIVINIVAKFMMKADSAFDPAVCRASVLANSKLNTALSNEWQVKCATRYHYFGKESYTEESGDKKIEVPYKRDLAYESCIKKNKDNEEAAEQCVIGVINKVIADRHKECWEQFGRGELSLFNRLDTKRQCVICSVYDFSEDLKENFDDRYVSEIVEEESNL
ncbi:MAG: hypothetical protein NDI94_03950, partial [Candidatus Woesearchaeota archaeon]|nr:hypothetical protein [Candidatus Woesearchaeota archaeon]